MRLGPEHPACMTPRDAELWWDAQRTVMAAFTRRTPAGPRKCSPCDDCDRAFAEAMRAEKRCDGTYPGEEPEHLAPSQYWQGYATPEERIAARRATWRRAGQRRRALQVAT